MRAAIVAGSYINFRDLLLPDEEQGAKRIRLEDGELYLDTAAKKGDLSVADWAEAFATFQEVLTAENRDPAIGRGLYAYQRMIMRMIRSQGREAAMAYDRSFRFKRGGAVDPDATHPWHVPDVQLFVRALPRQASSAVRHQPQATTSGSYGKPRPFRGFTSGEGPAGFKGTAAPSRRGHGRGGLCPYFNSAAGCRFGDSCTSVHKCMGCGDAHGGHKCPKRR
jgi:hypothetical protein